MSVDAGARHVGHGGRRDRGARGGPSRRRAALAACAAALGCASPSAPPEAAEAERLRAWLERAIAERPRADPTTLSVHLAFAADVDLDLYVTDPSQETVYFANTPSRAGGRLDADLQCGSGPPAAPGTPAKRAERVRYASPAPGRYRVSVDHPRSCGGARAAGYAVAVEHGGRVAFHTGSVRPREFRLVALELDLPETKR